MMISGWSHAASLPGVHCEECIFRWFCRLANVIEYAYTNPNSLDDSPTTALGPVAQPVVPMAPACTARYCVDTLGGRSTVIFVYLNIDKGQ